MTHTFVIAEAGVNHNGRLDLALALVDAARDAGADAVKFQTFRASSLVSRFAEKAAYQQRTTDAAESQLDMLRRLELDEPAHGKLVERCRERGIEFMSSPFDLESIAFLQRLGVRRLKIGSGQLTNAPFMLAAARTGLPLIVSTGMSGLGDVEAMLGVLAFGWAGTGAPSADAFERAYASAEGRRALLERLVLLHCTTEYPAPFEDVHLRAMDTLGSAFEVPVGFSDHTPGIAIPVAAVARGATVIEKHFTLDRGMEGPDHKASLEPAELGAMIQSIRQVERALGSSRKTAAPSELGNRAVARQSLVAARAVKAGERFSEDNLGIKRPGHGVSPLRYWEYLGRAAARDYAPDELIDP